MNGIKVLDCTLRDGGYCNQWKFGFENSKKIIKSLCSANIDIIECGFLTEKAGYCPDMTKFNTLDAADRLLPAVKRGHLFVVMMNYGEFDPEHLLPREDKGIDGIRLAFHKKDWKGALELGRKIKEKGYDLFLQPMVTLSYTDMEFLNLICDCNKIEPYAFYIVDSFGTMKKKELVRLYYLAEHHLKKETAIGFHSHNNMQLAYANAQTLSDLHAVHELIIDSSVYGMGRGAGNLNTELLIEYLNDNFKGRYHIQPLLSVIDSILDIFYRRNGWGYSLPNYLSASYNTHPNYAGYLSDKNALNVEDMDAILRMMDDEKRMYFDKEYAEQIYRGYLSAGRVYEQHKTDLQKILDGKSVLLIAPGKSSYEERHEIQSFSKEKGITVISVNHEYPYADTDYIFLSNLRRFRDLEKEKRKKCIVTSNISSQQVFLRTEYSALLNDYESVRDNAGLMAVKFLMMNGVHKIYMAGFDGYSHDSEANYASQSLCMITKNALMDTMNTEMSRVLGQYADKIVLRFITKPKYVVIS